MNMVGISWFSVEWFKYKTYSKVQILSYVAKDDSMECLNKTLMNIYTVESMAEFPGLDSMFMETKTELRTAFNKMDSRGRFGYREPNREKMLEDIQKVKNAPLIPLRPVSITEQEIASEDRVDYETMVPAPGITIED